MNIDLKIVKAIGRRFSELAIVAVVLWAGLKGDGGPRELTFIEESSTFAIQAVIITLIALAIVYMAQAIRACTWYDKNGAGTEIASIRDRIGDGKERPQDGVAIAIQYASTTIFLAAILFGFFLIHGG